MAALASRRTGRSFGGKRALPRSCPQSEILVVNATVQQAFVPVIRRQNAEVSGSMAPPALASPTTCPGIDLQGRAANPGRACR